MGEISDMDMDGASGANAYLSFSWTWCNHRLLTAFFNHAHRKTKRYPCFGVEDIIPAGLGGIGVEIASVGELDAFA